jgi:cytochrome c oxidase subunit 1
MRAPGMTWFRLPLFIWAHYATSLIMVLGTPVLAMTLIVLSRSSACPHRHLRPALGGDPVLFQHLFWFYSHPAVYIMILPSMGVISELVAVVSKKRVFGYEFVAFSIAGDRGAGFLVWGHHLFISGQSTYAGVVFSVISFLVAVPSAVKVFNWTFTFYKARSSLDAAAVRDRLHRAVLHRRADRPVLSRWGSTSTSPTPTSSSRTSTTSWSAAW